MPRPSARITTRSALTDSITPPRRASTTAWESRATTCSIPVPTSGASGWSSGTAWRCMFEPMRARFASSFSRNGIRLAATDTSCFGETSMYWTSSGGTSLNSPLLRASTRSATNFPRLSISALAWAMTTCSSSSAVRKMMSSETVPASTRRYGVSMNPNSLIRAYVESDEMSPMFGPSGVSIGQIRP